MDVRFDKGKRQPSGSTQRDIKDHHHQETAYESEGRHIREAIPLCLGHHFFYHYVDHCPGCEGKSIGQKGLHVKDSNRSDHSGDGFDNG